MICLDCAQTGLPYHDVVGVCHECGAAVCLEHAVISKRVLTRPAAILREDPVDPPARLITCVRCHEALEAAHTGRGAHLAAVR